MYIFMGDYFMLQYIFMGYYFSLYHMFYLQRNYVYTLIYFVFVNKFHTEISAFFLSIPHHTDWTFGK